MQRSSGGKRDSRSFGVYALALCAFEFQDTQKLVLVRSKGYQIRETWTGEPSAGAMLPGWKTMNPIDYPSPEPLPSRSSSVPAWISLLLAIAALPCALWLDHLLLTTFNPVAELTRDRLVVGTLTLFSLSAIATGAYALVRKTWAFVTAMLGLLIGMGFLFFIASRVFNIWGAR